MAFVTGLSDRRQTHRLKVSKQWGKGIKKMDMMGLNGQ